MTALERVTDALESQGLKIKHTGRDTAMAQCPAHNDNNPSLSLRQIPGQALMYCHAGCQTPDVLQALGLTAKDLFDNRKEVTYHYSDGRVVHRTPEKEFYQTGQNGRVLLYTPDGLNLQEALAAGAPIFLPEGEKDVDILWSSCGAAAVTSPMGAGNWEKCDYTILTGATNLVIIQDRDDAGVKRANGLYHHLRSIGAQVIIVEPADGKDVTDHLMLGHALEELQLARQPEIGQVKPQLDPRMDPQFDSSMLPLLPMEWAWQDMIPLGGLTLLVGTGGIGKTSFATYLISQLQHGLLEGNLFGVRGKALWIGNEDSWQRTILPRFILNGGDRKSEMFSRMRMPKILVEEHGEIPSLPMHLDVIRRGIEMTGAKLILVDPIISLLGNGLDGNNAADVRRAMQPLNAMAEELNVTILGVHHLNKNMSLSADSRLSGSHAWRDVSRAIITFAMDQDADMVILSNTKSNVGIDGRSFAYRKQRTIVEYDGIPFDLPKVDWIGEVARTADDVMSDEAVMGRGGELKREIVHFIVHAGRPVSTKEILDEMIDEQMIASGPANVKMALGRLVKAGVVARVGRGQYGPPDPRVQPRNDESNNPRVSPKSVTSVTNSLKSVTSEDLVTQVTASESTRGSVTFCRICGLPLPDRLIQLGETTHATCD